MGEIFCPLPGLRPFSAMRRRFGEEISANKSMNLLTELPNRDTFPLERDDGGQAEGTETNA